MLSLAVGPAAEDRANDPEEEDKQAAVEEAHEARTGLVEEAAAEAGAHHIVDAGFLLPIDILEGVLGLDCEEDLLGLSYPWLVEVADEGGELLFVAPEDEFILD